MSDMKRRKQNRDAQRKFREKQAQQAQLSKQQFEQLTSRYEALLNENKSLKDQCLSRENCSMQVTEDSSGDFLGSTSIEREFDSLPPSQGMSFPGEFDGTLFGLEAQDVRLRTPGVDEVIEASISASGIDYAALSFDELQHTVVPTIEHPPDYAVESAVAKALTLPGSGAETGRVHGPSSSTFTDAASGLGYGPCSSTSSFDTGYADTLTHCIPKTDLVQALLQMAFAQERIALIDLERAKLRLCAW